MQENVSSLETATAVGRMATTAITTAMAMKRNGATLCDRQIWCDAQRWCNAACCAHRATLFDWARPDCTMRADWGIRSRGGPRAAVSGGGGHCCRLRRRFCGPTPSSSEPLWLPASSTELESARERCPLESWLSVMLAEPPPPWRASPSGSRFRRRPSARAQTAGPGPGTRIAIEATIRGVGNFHTSTHRTSLEMVPMC